GAGLQPEQASLGRREEAPGHGPDRVVLSVLDDEELLAHGPGLVARAPREARSALLVDRVDDEHAPGILPLRVQRRSGAGHEVGLALGAEVLLDLAGGLRLPVLAEAHARVVLARAPHHVLDAHAAAALRPPGHQQA